tara:strand:- start:6077 stop:7675 length:1599 start_codon:yes stop_codon:yes gene_type:complete
MGIRDPNSGFLGGLLGRGNAPFFEIYVQEVLTDPSRYEFAGEDEEKPESNLLFGNSIPQAAITDAPYNSIIGRVVRGHDVREEVIAYPMMQGHMMLPVKAGEHVWGMINNGRYYWLCRKNFDSQVDDVNLAWGGRFKSATNAKRTSESANAAEGGEDASTLPSNQHPRINAVFPPVAEDPGEIDMQTYWAERSKGIYEAVPRYKKRPGDLVLQGSNNTLICLGTGGGHTKEAELTLETTSISELEVTEDSLGSGTIDLVTGRGRYAPAKATTDASSLGDTPERTSAATIVSEFGYTEVDKNPEINDITEKNLIEGDPDFGFDASRIYISSKSDIDSDFTLIPNYPPIPAVQTEGDVGVVPETSNGSAIALKSDNIRLIARQHIASDFFETTTAEDVQGSIRIVKEGIRDSDGHSSTNDDGASLIALESDGTVMIDGAMIVIGTGREESNGAGDQVYIGAGATEPLVLGNQMKQLLSDFFTELSSWLSTKFDTHIHPTGTGPSGPPTVTGNDAGTGAAKDALDSTLSKVGKTK